MMVEAFLYASEDSDADSQEIRRNAFERKCRVIATTVLHSEAEARREELTSTVSELADYLQLGERIEIQRGSNGVDIEVTVNG